MDVKAYVSRHVDAENADSLYEEVLLGMSIIPKSGGIPVVRVRPS